MDTTQLLLMVVLSVTTILLIIIGIQLIFLLRELRKALKKVNQIIEGFERLGISVEHGYEEIIGFFGGIKSLFRLIDFLHAKKHEKSKSSPA